MPTRYWTSKREDDFLGALKHNKKSGAVHDVDGVIVSLGALGQVLARDQNTGKLKAHTNYSGYPSGPCKKYKVERAVLRARRKEEEKQRAEQHRLQLALDVQRVKAVAQSAKNDSMGRRESALNTSTTARPTNRHVRGNAPGGDNYRYRSRSRSGDYRRSYSRQRSRSPRSRGTQSSTPSYQSSRPPSRQTSRHAQLPPVPPYDRSSNLPTGHMANVRIPQLQYDRDGLPIPPPPPPNFQGQRMPPGGMQMPYNNPFDQYQQFSQFSQNAGGFQRGYHASSPPTGRGSYQQQGNGSYQQQGNGPYQQQGNAPYQQQGNAPYQQQGNAPYQQQGNAPYQQQGNAPYQQQGNGSYQQQGGYGYGRGAQSGNPPHWRGGHGGRGRRGGRRY
ncbi:hypothetical protein LTR50_001637 [Elasticomyces elasticus]|nr:hypothetical protein LTR50_001637 [Elasticomyces elasticus]